MEISQLVFHKLSLLSREECYMKWLYGAGIIAIILIIALLSKCLNHLGRNASVAINLELVCIAQYRGSELAFDENGLCGQQVQIWNLLAKGQHMPKTTNPFLLASKGVVISGFQPDSPNATKGDLLLHRTDSKLVYIYAFNQKYKWLATYPGLWPVQEPYNVSG
jgi:hypothetical protein